MGFACADADGSGVTVVSRRVSDTPMGSTDSVGLWQCHGRLMIAGPEPQLGGSHISTATLFKTTTATCIDR